MLSVPIIVFIILTVILSGLLITFISLWSSKTSECSDDLTDDNDDISNKHEDMSIKTVDSNSIKNREILDGKNITTMQVGYEGPIYNDVTRSADGFLYMAFFFPQWHYCPENTADGQYYTDWRYVYQTADRAITPKRYYNMNSQEVMNTQDQLAADHNLGVFIFHHYWLDNKMMMNLPIDLFIQKKRKTKFMLSWDNETGWMGEQLYDSPEQHAYQLLRYFKSENYLTDKNGKKPFSIYLTKTTPVKYLTLLCKFLLMHDIQIKIGTFFQKYHNEWDMPDWSEISVEFGPHTHENKTSLSNPYKQSLHAEHWQGLLVNWCSRPRSQCPRSRYYKLAERDTDFYDEREVFDEIPTKTTDDKYFDPDDFKKALTEMKNKIAQNNQDKIITLSSWNEWSEGSVLETSLEYGNRFLEILSQK